MPVFEFSKHLYLDQVEIYPHTFFFYFMTLTLTHACLLFSPLATDPEKISKPHPLGLMNVVSNS